MIKYEYINYYLFRKFKQAHSHTEKFVQKIKKYKVHKLGPIHEKVRHKKK